jgi:hypothetical protein
MMEMWQALMIDRKVNTWMERHTQYINVVPFGALGLTTLATTGTLDTQLYFDKAMDTIAALNGQAQKVLPCQTAAATRHSMLSVSGG